MGLLSGSPGHSHRLHCDGYFRQFTHQLPSLDLFNCFPTLPLLPGAGLCSGLCFRLVIDSRRGDLTSEYIGVLFGFYKAIYFSFSFHFTMLYMILDNVIVSRQAFWFHFH